ncbi:MAG: YceH family protein [Acidimicrobiia bacterium]
MEPPAEIDLDPVQQRVIGSLLEKERTVPDTYPMTVNGLRTACNQASGRDPIMQLSELEVTTALTELRAMGLTRVIHPSHGARQPKYRQVLDEVLRLDDGERAVLTLLLLRGPQTPGELRSRSERLHPFGGLAEVESALAGLAGRGVALVRELPRRPGQKEARWIHLLGEPPVVGATPARASADEALQVLRTENDELRRRLAEVESERDRLRQELDELTKP